MFADYIVLHPPSSLCLESAYFKFMAQDELVAREFVERNMNTIKIALAAAILASAVAPSFAGGLDNHDPLAVLQAQGTGTDAFPPAQSTGSGGQTTGSGASQSH